MALFPVPAPGFAAGLNLRDAPADTGPEFALDCLNVIFPERGAVRKRDGTALFTSTALTNGPDSLQPFYKVDGTKRLIVGNGNDLRVLDTTGTIVAGTANPTASPHTFTRFGGPTVEAVYIANGTDQVRRYDTSGGFTTPAGLSGQTGKFLAVTSVDNRLVVARESGGTAGNNPSSVNFSNAGDPETFDALNYVDITPGDGEEIMGLCSWQNYVFAFKKSKFAVFYGTSTGVTGDPVFEKRMVEAGVGLSAPQCLAVAPEGVYFLDRRGVYRTTGGTPELVSDAIAPIFDGNTNVYFRSSPLNLTAVTKAKMTWWNRRIYLAFPSGGVNDNDRTLVYDPQHNWWSLWDIPASCLTSFRIGDYDELVFGYSDANHIGRHRGRFSYLNDAMDTDGTGGTAISSRWRSGWWDLGSYAGKKRNVSRMLWGQGNVTVKTSVDYETNPVVSADLSLTGSLDTWGGGTGTDTWGGGTGPDLWGPTTILAQDSDLQGIGGTVFSIELVNSALDENFAVHRLIHHLSQPIQRPEAF